MHVFNKLSFKNCFCMFFGTISLDGQIHMTGWPFWSTGWPICHPVNMLGEDLYRGQERWKSRFMVKMFFFAHNFWTKKASDMILAAPRSSRRDASKYTHYTSYILTLKKVNFRIWPEVKVTLGHVFGQVGHIAYKSMCLGERNTLGPFLAVYLYFIKSGRQKNEFDLIWLWMTRKRVHLVKTAYGASRVPQYKNLRR